MSSWLKHSRVVYIFSNLLVLPATLIPSIDLNLRLAHQMRFVPQPVMDGFVNGLAILIFLAQLPHLGIDIAHSEKIVGDFSGKTNNT